MKTAALSLSPADGEQKIVVTDKAGNTAEMTVTVNDGHTGGKATCTEKAVCEVCGKPYGELDPKNHTDLMHIPAKAATEEARAISSIGTAAAAESITVTKTAPRKSPKPTP